MQESRQTHQLMPISSNTGWLYWPLGRLIVLGSFLLPIALSLIVNLGWLGLIMGAIGLVLIWPFPSKHGYGYQALHVALLSRKERRRRKRLGSYRTPALKEVLVHSDTGKASHKPVEFVQPQIIPLEGGSAGFLTEIYTPANNRHTFYAMGEGQGELVASDPDQILVHSSAFARTMANLSDDYGTDLYGALIFTRVPYNLEDAVHFLRGMDASREQAAPEPQSQRLLAQLRKQRELQQDNFRAMEQQADNATDFVSAIGLSVGRPRSWSKYPLDQIPAKEIRDAIGYKLIDQLNNDLASRGVKHIRRATPYDVSLLLKASLDLTELDSLYADWFTDKMNERSGLLKSFSDSLVMSSGFLPQDWSPSHTYLRIGDSYHRMFIVPGFPYREVPAGLLQYLFNAPEDIWYGISTVYKTIPIERERRRVKLKRSDQDSKRHDRYQRGSSASAEEEDEAFVVDSMDQRLYNSTSEAVQMNMLATVTAGSVDELNEASEKLKRMFRRVHLPLTPIKGEARQVPFRLASLGIRSDRI